MPWAAACVSHFSSAVLRYSRAWSATSDRGRSLRPLCLALLGLLQAVGLATFGPDRSSCPEVRAVNEPQAHFARRFGRRLGLRIERQCREGGVEAALESAVEAARALLLPDSASAEEGFALVSEPSASVDERESCSESGFSTSRGSVSRSGRRFASAAGLTRPN
ncbi:unnamed protein product [Polarella glacialis]|uniref:Uncharacterized protein n=1 Tax=Polarella glacialis TaxID=89957 RepID=A0A813HFT9_POLGL|nr:unnamed protein product [Polarella glacialis]